jgi:hypothetical protein
MTVFLVVAPCSLVDVSEVLTASIIRAMNKPRAAVGTSEMSVNFYETTLCNNPEDSHHLDSKSLPIHYLFSIYSENSSYCHLS